MGIQETKNSLINDIMNIRISVNEMANELLRNDEDDKAQKIVEALNNLQDRVFNI